MPTAQDFDDVLEHVLGCTRHPKSHLKWQYHINGTLIGWCMRSHGLRKSAQLSDRNLKEMATEMRCSFGLWKRLMNRQATLVDYLDELVERGFIDQNQYKQGLTEYQWKRRK
jgi:hypothetical protein